MEWMLMPLKRYADFKGRSRRKEYWMFFLFQFLVHIAFIFVLIVLMVVASRETMPPAETVSIAGPTGNSIPLLFLIGFWALFWLAMLIPNVAIVVRRFHDQGISGIVGVLLYVGALLITIPGIVILIFMCIDGKKGDNQYGEDPKLNENVGEIFQ